MPFVKLNRCQICGSTNINEHLPSKIYGYFCTKCLVRSMGQADIEYDNQFGLAGTRYYEDLLWEWQEARDKYYNGWADWKGGVK